jgi:hypothetical protein
MQSVEPGDIAAAAATAVPASIPSLPIFKMTAGKSKSGAAGATLTSSSAAVNATSPDAAGSFFVFQRLCQDLAAVPAHSDKTARLVAFLRKEYCGDKFPLFKLLLPKAVNRVYHMGDKTLVKVLTTLLGFTTDKMEAMFNSGPHAGSCAQTECVCVCVQFSVYLLRWYVCVCRWCRFSSH